MNQCTTWNVSIFSPLGPAAAARRRRPGRVPASPVLSIKPGAPPTALAVSQPYYLLICYFFWPLSALCLSATRA